MRVSRLIVALLALILASLGFAQMPDPVQWSGTIEPAKIRPGDQGVLILKGTVQKPWHIYSLKKVEDGPFPTTITPQPVKGITFGEPTQSDPIKKLDEAFGKEVEYYEGEVEFRQPFTVAKDATGEALVAVEVKYQVCNEGSCLPPKGKPVSGKVTIDPNAPPSTVLAIPPPAAVKEPSPSSRIKKALSKPGKGAEGSDVEKARAQGLLPFLALAAGGGLFALLTPCVFPMIPITVSFFSKRKQNEGWKQGLGQAAAYCGGIIGTFTGLGLMVAVLFRAGGVSAFANHPVLNAILAVVFIVLAFSLFGAFEIGLPPALVNKFSGKTGGVLGPVFMGLTFSLTSFTCTLPIVGGLLVLATQGDVLWAVLGMITFSTVFSLPFFLLALFPQALAKMPKSGSWLATTKAYMGFIELLAAVKFLSSVDLGINGGLGWITRPVYLAIWSAIAVLAGLYMLGLIRLPKLDEGKIGIVRRGVGAATLLLAGWFLTGLNGRSIGELEAFMPPDPYPGKAATTSAIADKLTWLTSYEEAKVQAAAQRKPIFIDFTGVYCTNCRWMERNMFSRPEIEEQLEGYVRLKLYTDRDTPEDQENQKLMIRLTRTITLPTYVIVDASGNAEVSAFTRDETAFGDLLKRGFEAK